MSFIRYKVTPRDSDTNVNSEIFGHVETKNGHNKNL
jgi:hypothetical protein